MKRIILGSLLILGSVLWFDYSKSQRADSTLSPTDLNLNKVDSTVTSNILTSDDIQNFEEAELNESTQQAKIEAQEQENFAQSTQPPTIPEDGEIEIIKYTRQEIIEKYCAQYRASEGYQNFCIAYLGPVNRREQWQFLNDATFHRSPDPYWGADSELDLEQWMREMPNDLKQEVKLSLPECNDWICFVQIDNRILHADIHQRLFSQLKNMEFEQVFLHYHYQRGRMGIYMFRYPAYRFHFNIYLSRFQDED